MTERETALITAIPRDWFWKVEEVVNDSAAGFRITARGAYEELVVESRGLAKALLLMLTAKQASWERYHQETRDHAIECAERSGYLPVMATVV